MYRTTTLILLLALFLGSCSTTNLLFVEELNKEGKNTIWLDENAKIEVGDKLTISIWGHESLSIGSVNSVYNSNEETGKWVVVGPSGEVNLPKVGRVKVAGYTCYEVNYVLEQKYLAYINNPIINVKVLNHYVMILGEVKNPGRYKIDNEKLNLTELIAQANGFTDYAKLDKIQLIRQGDSTISKININYTEQPNLSTHFITILPDDLVYVAPKKGKNIAKSADKVAPFVGIVTAVAVLLSVIVK